MSSNSYHKELEGLNGRLPKGITASGTWYGPRLVITYQVRFMLDGQRVNLGTFVDLLAAIRAMVEYKATKLYKVAQEELTKREALIIQAAEQVALQGVQDQHEVLTTHKTAMLTCATSVLHPSKLEGNGDVDFLWSKELGGDDKVYVITPKMLRSYYAGIERAAKEQRLRAEQNELLKLGQPAAANHAADHIKAIELAAGISSEESLSDAEYNKMLGLDD